MRETEHHPRALNHRRIGPFRKRLPGRLHRPIHFAPIAVGRLRDQFTARWIVDWRELRSAEHCQVAADVVIKTNRSHNISNFYRAALSFSMVYKVPLAQTVKITHSL